jgi:hypothetical protein
MQAHVSSSSSFQNQLNKTAKLTVQKRLNLLTQSPVTTVAPAA